MRNLCAALLVLLGTRAAPADWTPPTAAEMAMKAPQIDPEADAEALLWDVRLAHKLDEGYSRTDEWHYLKVKVFTEAGRDRLGSVDIPYGTNHSISGIAARTIRPDGSVVELQEGAIQDRTVMKAGEAKVKAKSFALPGLEVGSIIEYRWTETMEHRITSYIRLPFQRDVPIHTVRYHVKPITDPAFRYGMSSLSMNFKGAPFTKEKDGFYVISANRMPAFKHERDMPPEALVRPWVLVFYTDNALTSDQYWEATGKVNYASYRSHVKMDDAMERAASAAVQGAEGDEARLAKLYDFVIRGIANSDYGSDDEEARETRTNRNTADAWKQKAGTGYDVTLVFLALAEALGYEARPAMVAMKDFGAFNKNLTIPYFLRSFDAAVKVGGTWRFADPGSSLLPFGMLDWREQGQAALIADPRQPQLVVTPIAEPGASLTRREGRFKLSASGDLAGEVRLVYRGHSAWRRRYSYRRASPSEREEAVRKTVTDRHRSATVEQISIDGLLGSEELTIGYRVKIPGYAERTGRRLFLQCALFNRNLTPRYPSGGARTHPIAYENAWSEEDDFTFELPAGYAFESPDAPAGIKIGDFGDYRARFTVSPDLRTLRYERMFEFGRGGRLTFPVEAYSALKRVFDQVQEADNHSLALRQEAP